MTEETGRPAQDPTGDPSSQLPSPSIWPFGFAAGVALVLVGLVVSWPAAAVGAGIALVFGFLWVRELTVGVRPQPVVAEAPAQEEEDEEEVELERYPRAKFLEGATLGLGAVIGGVITAPVVGFAVAPAFVGQGYEDVDLGPLSNFPEGRFVVATFLSESEEGKVGARTAYVRNNGPVDGQPSFTILSNRCVHLGCPVQPNGPLQQPTEVEVEGGRTVTLTPAQPAGFGCPCHGGAYDNEGNRTAGPPVRALDRYRFSIKGGRLVLGGPFSVARVEGEREEALIYGYEMAADPGQHVDGIEQILYPLIP